MVLFKLDAIFSHEFHVRKGLLCTDSTYSRVPGDQGGWFFSHLVFFLRSFITPICSILYDLCIISFSGSLVILLSSCMLQQLSTVTLHLLAFLPEFSSSFQRHDIQQVAYH